MLTQTGRWGLAAWIFGIIWVQTAGMSHRLCLLTRLSHEKKQILHLPSPSTSQPVPSGFPDPH